MKLLLDKLHATDYVLFAINDSLMSTTIPLHIPEPSGLGIAAIFFI